jgi:membrane protease YdiL (CAAX protease family)
MTLISSPAQIAQHLLALFLIVLGPIWDYFHTLPLKASPSGPARLRYYQRTMLWLWISSAIACWASLPGGFFALFSLSGMGIRAAWLPGWPWWVLAGICVLVVLLQLVLPVVQVTVKYRNRPFLEPRQLEPLRFFLPASPLERRWFAALSLTAGFCEELLFRGFLLRYLHCTPFHLGLIWVVLISAVVFSAHHLYQGKSGVISTGIGALIFTAILLVTGSLLAGMIYHALADLSILLYWRPRPAAAPA